MLCNECGKNNATVHLTQIINGKKTESHLCEECAKKRQALFNSTFSIENLFSGMLNDQSAAAGYAAGKSCSVCGMTYEEFRSTGKFGCSHCIEDFKPRLMPVIKDIQGYGAHIGKIPKRAGGSYRLQRDIENLRLKLKQAIDQEEYEAAARLRDEIRSMEKRLS